MIKNIKRFHILLTIAFLIVCFVLAVTLLRTMIYQVKGDAEGKENGSPIFMNGNRYAYSKNFAFISEIRIKELPNGKDVPVKITASFLKGMINPIISGEWLYYEESWDGVGQGVYYRIHLTRGIKRKELVAELANAIACDGDDVYWYTSSDYEKKISVYHTKENGDSEIIQDMRGDGGLQIFTLSEKSLLMYNKQEGNLILYDIQGNRTEEYTMKETIKGGVLAVAIRHDSVYLVTDAGQIYVLNRNDGIVTFKGEIDVGYGGYYNPHRYAIKVDSSDVYYCNSHWDLCKFDISDGKNKTVITVYDYVGDTIDEVVYFWTKDHIVAKVDFVNPTTRREELIFDDKGEYLGKL